MEKQVRFCSHCGAKLRENANFCGKCGNRINNIRNNKESMKIFEEKTAISDMILKKPVPVNSRGMIERIAAVIVALLVVLCIALCIISGSSGNIEKKLVGTWIDNDNDAVELVFYKDGSYKHGNNAVRVNGDYTCVSETEIELTSNQVGLGYDLWNVAGIHEFKLDGKSLYIENVGSFTKKK